MSCRVNRSEKGMITEVVLENGQLSVLFNKINSNAFIPNAEVALNIYSNAYTEMFEQGEPELKFKDIKGNIYDSMEDIFINDTDGTIEMGFDNQGQFTSVAVLDTQISETAKFISKQIKEGLLSTEKIVDPDGQTFLSGKGSKERTKAITAQLVKERANFPVEVRSDGAIELKTDSNYITANLKNGETVTVTKEEIPTLLKRNDVEDKVALILQYEDFTNRSFEEGAEKPTDKSKLHITNLKSFLNSLGFSTTSLDAYSKAFKNRHGKDPDVSALIDLANRVVAIAEGGNQMELMSEEVAHLAVETYNDQGSILGALTDIHLTPEYNQWAEVYRQKYSKQFEGLALEEAVRKEILGKVIAKAIQNNTQLSEESLTIWQRIKNYFSSIFKPAHRRTLDRLSEQISKDILSNNLSAFSLDNIKGEGVFYSVGNEKTTASINGAIKALDSLAKKVKGSNRLVVPTRLREIEATASILAELQAIDSIQGVVRANLNIINTKLKSEDPNSKLTSFDIATFQSLQTQLIPSIGNYISYIDSNYPSMSASEKGIAKALRENLNEITQSMAVMSDKVDKSTEGVFTENLRKDLKERGLSDEEINKLVDEATGVMKDTTSLSSNFGIFSFSSNILKGYVGDIVQKMYSEVRLKLNRSLNPILNKIEKEGLGKFQRSIIKRDEEGNQTYYYENGLRLDLYDKAFEDFRVETLKKLLPDASEEVIKQTVKSNNVSALITSPTQRSEYEDAVLKWKRENNENIMPESYYKEKEEMEKEANVSEDSMYEMRNLRAQIAEILSSVRDEKTGKVDKSKLLPEQRVEIERLHRAMATKKSVVSQSGLIYEGLRVSKWEELTEKEKQQIPFANNPFLSRILSKTNSNFTVLKEGSTLEDLSPDARLALDMFNLNMVMRLKAEKEGKSFERNLSEKVLEDIKKLEAEGRFEEVYDFMMSNSTITFTDEYYESLQDSQPNYLDDAQAEIESMEDGAKKDLKRAELEELKQLLIRRRELAKQYRKVGNSTEEVIPDGSIKSIRLELDEQIALKKRSLAIKNLTEAEGEPLSTRELSKEYRDSFKESGQDKFTFAQNHMTRDNITNLLNFEKYLRDNLLNAIDTEVDEKFEEFIEEQQNLGLIDDTKSTEEIYRTLRDNYAESRLASYAYSYKIGEFENLLEKAKIGDVRMSDIIEKSERFPVLKYAKLNVDYEWAETSSDLNPYFMKAYGKSVPKFSKYKDEQFFSKYGITEENYLNSNGDVTKLTPTQNVQEFEMLKVAISVNHLRNENENDTVNIYLRPQISKGTYEKIKSTRGVKSAGREIKDSLLDSISYRADEKEYGETDNNVPLIGNGIKVPPRMFQNKLEDPNLLTEDTTFAMALSLRESFLYKGRIENIDKVNLVIRHAKTSEFDSGGIVSSKITKRGEVSNVYKDLVQYADDRLYGIKQTRQLEINIGGRTVDMTKAIRSLQSLSSSFNLKYNPFVSATSLTTGLYNNLQNWIVGDDMHKSSYQLAVNSLLTDIGKYLPDSTNVNRVSRLNTRMEGFGLVDASEKVENAKDSTIERNSLKIGHMLDRIANLPVVPRVLYTILKDTRFFNDTFVSFNQFATIQKNKNKNITKSEIESLWKSLENETFDTFMDDTTGVLKPNQKFLDKGFTEAIFDKYVLNISSKAKQIVQVVDGQLNEGDRVMAQRDVFLNTLMQHKGWLPINMYKMFRGKHFNFATNKYETGHYRTAFMVTREVVKRLKNPSEIKEYWKDLSEGDKKNLKRVLVHTTMMLGVMAVVLGLNASDDDDDTFLEDFTRYIAHRTYGEINSLTPFGMYRSVKDTAKQPFVVLSSYEKWTDIPMSIFSSEEGSFVSATMKGTPLKRIEQLQDLDATTATWRRFNDDNVALLKYFED